MHAGRTLALPLVILVALLGNAARASGPETVVEQEAGLSFSAERGDARGRWENPGLQASATLGQGLLQFSAPAMYATVLVPQGDGGVGLLSWSWQTPEFALRRTRVSFSPTLEATPAEAPLLRFDDGGVTPSLPVQVQRDLGPVSVTAQFGPAFDPRAGLSEWVYGASTAWALSDVTEIQLQLNGARPPDGTRGESFVSLVAAWSVRSRASVLCGVGMPASVRIGSVVTHAGLLVRL